MRWEGHWTTEARKRRAAGSHKRKRRDRKKAGPSEEEKMYNLKGGTLRINHKPF